MPMFEWILLAQQAAQHTAQYSAETFGDNSLAATIVGAAAAIVTAMVKLMPTMEHARLRSPAEVVTAPPPVIPESIDLRLRALEAHFAKLEERLGNQGNDISEMRNDMRELFGELRKMMADQRGR